jgi:hypothetical protein
MYPGSFIFMKIQQQLKDTKRQEKPITCSMILLSLGMPTLKVDAHHL